MTPDDRLPPRPFDVFIVVVKRTADGDEYPVCVTAKVVEIHRTWWVVEHTDGSCTNHNGGMIGEYSGKVPGVLSHHYRLSIVEAYCDAAQWLMWSPHPDEWEACMQQTPPPGYLSFATRKSLLYMLIRRITEEFHEYGVLEARAGKDRPCAQKSVTA